MATCGFSGKNWRDLTPEQEQELLEQHLNRVTDTCIPEEEAIRRIEDGSIRVEPLLSASVPLAGGGEWFARLANNTEGLLKIILKP